MIHNSFPHSSSMLDKKLFQMQTYRMVNKFVNKTYIPFRIGTPSKECAHFLPIPSPFDSIGVKKKKNLRGFRNFSSSHLFIELNDEDVGKKCIHSFEGVSIRHGMFTETIKCARPNT